MMRSIYTFSGAYSAMHKNVEENLNINARTVQNNALIIMKDIFCEPLPSHISLGWVSFHSKKLEIITLKSTINAADLSAKCTDNL